MMRKPVALETVRRVLTKAGFTETKTKSGSHLIFQHPVSKSFITLPNTSEVRPTFIRAVVKTLVDNGFYSETKAELSLRLRPRQRRLLVCKGRYLRCSSARKVLHVREQ